jgi:hypothetical protein
MLKLVTFVDPTEARYRTTQLTSGSRAAYRPPAPPNDQAHLTAGISERHVTESLYAPQVRCSGWFGLMT